MIETGKLAGWISSGTIYGVTSNPTIFGQAIEKNEGDYDHQDRRPRREGRDAFQIYDELTRRRHRRRGGRSSRASRCEPAGRLDLPRGPPELAFDADGPWRRRGACTKPWGARTSSSRSRSTPAGCVAIRKLIGTGVSVNVTLMFNRKHYSDVATAYLDGLEDLVAAGGDPRKVLSVASFFVSRVDTLVDRLLDEKARSLTGAAHAHAEALRGKAGLANCKVVYQDFRELFASPRFAALKAKGAWLQRPLWASTGTKNPAYSDLLYVENLLGPDTVNTVPEKTLDALLDHGRDLGDTVLSGVDEARKALADLLELGIDVEAVGEKLQGDGVVAFAKSYDDLLKVIEERRKASLLESAKTQKIRTT